MVRGLLCFGLVAILLSGLAGADEGELVLRVSRSAGREVLSDAGMLFLAGLGEDYLVFGDRCGRERLAARGISSQTVTVVAPGDEIFLLRPRTFEGEVLLSGMLTDLGRGNYLAAVPSHQIEDLESLPFSKVRLLPGAFPQARRHGVLGSPGAVTPDPRIAALVAGVSGDTLWKYISQLSGRESVVIQGRLDTLYTRFTYHEKINDASDYLVERFRDYGVDVWFHHYAVGTHTFYDADFVDRQNGWVVGSDQRVFRTRDGGLSWVRQTPDSDFPNFWAVCFLDTLKGWIAGTAGTIRHTEDGGITWSAQTSPIGQTFQDVFFLDQLTGYMVGYGGTIIRTTDGGLSWTLEASGTTEDLFGCHFQSADRGWAVGEKGTVVFWDGETWSARASGTTEYLFDVSFIDDTTGWVAGGGRTLLKTTDGGLNWTAQTAPAAVSPFFKGLCFVDALNGWVVGLNGTIIHTTDGGATWTPQDSGTLFGLRSVRFVNATEGWIAGYGCTVLHTDDAGATWENQRRNLPASAVIHLKNVVATKPGTVSDQEVVICGHYDSISEDPGNLAPGADDNASGTAAVLEAARVLSACQFERTIKFLCFSGEEQGLFGSGEYAGDARAAGDSITAALNFDMIGYANVSPEDIDLIGNEESEWLVDFTADCAGAYVPSLLTRKSINPDEVLSDHASFWKAGYTSLLGVEDENLTYPAYHSTADTLGNLSQPFATGVVKMAVAALAELAGIDTTSSNGGGSGALAARAHPNPFITETTISFTLGTTSRVRVRVLDVQGRLVATLLEDDLPAGVRDVAWDATDKKGRRVAPGIYFTEVTAGKRTSTAKIVALR